MSNVYEFSRRERRYDEASQWLARLDRQLSRDEEFALQEWMAEDPANEALLLDMAALWDKMDALTRLSTLFQPPVAARRRGLFGIAAMGAASMMLIVVLVVGVLWLRDAPSPPSQPLTAEYVYQTGIGERSPVTLPDGTTLQLNTDSRIRVEYTGEYRLLALERGEVYVEVARDESRPLSVVAGNQVVQAVGTAFNVQISDDQQIELVVLEGKVRIGVREREAFAGKRSVPAVLDESSPVLVARQSARLSDAGRQISQVTAEEIAVNLSWRDGNLVFRGESLEEAVREIERYTSVEFVFLDEELKRIRVAGLFKAGDVEGLLATLRENFDIVYQYTESEKVLLGAR